jgi:hypothetical protein
MKSYPIKTLSGEEIDITFKSVIPQFPMEKWDKDLQQPACRILSVKLKTKKDDITDSLSACLLKALPVIGLPDHVLCLTSSGRSGSLAYKNRWMPMTKALLD